LLLGTPQHHHIRLSTPPLTWHLVNDHGNRILQFCRCPAPRQQKKIMQLRRWRRAHSTSQTQDTGPKKQEARGNVGSIPKRNGLFATHTSTHTHTHILWQKSLRMQKQIKTKENRMWKANRITKCGTEAPLPPSTAPPPFRFPTPSLSPDVAPTVGLSTQSAAMLLSRNFWLSLVAGFTY